MIKSYLLSIIHFFLDILNQLDTQDNDIKVEHHLSASLMYLDLRWDNLHCTSYISHSQNRFLAVEMTANFSDHKEKHERNENSHLFHWLW